MKEADTYDIPIKNKLMQKELGICEECGKRKAKYLCDYVIGKSFDLYGKGRIQQSTCDKYLCENCTNRINERDYCSKHIFNLKVELGAIKCNYKKF